MTLHRQVYFYLRDNGPATARQVADALGLSRQRATNTLHDLRLKGLSRPLAKAGRGCFHELVPGSRPPKDGRGHSPASKAALQEWSKINIWKTLAKRGRYPKPKPATALEQAWGFVPLPSRNCEDEKVVVE